MLCHQRSFVVRTGYSVAVYVYTEDRKGDLSGNPFKGFRVCPKWMAKSGLPGESQKIICRGWHSVGGYVQRKFFNFHVATKSPLAHEALQRLAALCAIESDTWI